MLRHSKIGMSNIIGYFFSLSNKPMYDILERKICKDKSKAKRSKMLLNMIASVFSRRCGSYRIYLEGDSPHQAVMIVCELKWFSYISNRHNMYTLMQSCDIFFTYNTQYCLLFLIHVQIQCDLAITSFTCVNVYSLNCLDLFLRYKIG